MHLFRIKIAAAVLQVRDWSKIITFRIVFPSLSSRLHRGSKLLGIVLGDVPILPDVQMIFLGLSHSLFIVLQKFGEPSTTLPLYEKQAIPHKTFTDILFSDMSRDERIRTNPINRNRYST